MRGRERGEREREREREGGERERGGRGKEGRQYELYMYRKVYSKLFTFMKCTNTRKKHSQ